MDYQISYEVIARDVSLFNSSVISVNNSMAFVNGSTDSFVYNLMDAMYFVEGVTVDVTVEVVNDTVVGQSQMTSIMASGSEFVDLYADLSLSLSLSLPPFLPLFPSFSLPHPLTSSGLQHLLHL